MKKIFLMLLIAGMGTVANAQNAASEQRVEKNQTATLEQRAESFSGRLTKELGLTDEQRRKVYDVKLTQLKKNAELDTKYPGDDRKNHEAEYKAVQDQFVASLKTILTPEQFKTLEAKKAEKGTSTTK